MAYDVLNLNGLGMEANAYLIDCERPLLVDVGTGARLEELEAALASSLRGRGLALIALTHMHFDHTGGAARLQARTGADAVAHPPDSRALAEGDSELTCSGWLGERQRPVRVREVREGDVLELGEAELKVLHTPGHSAGSICLYDRENCVLFSGDTVFTGGGVGRWDLPTGSREELVRSLERLVGLDVEALYPGHGPYVETGGREHIEMGLGMARDFF
ncbi:MAG: MBL fold metallo-hydrolase [Thermoplasmatota archaeon]